MAVPEGQQGSWRVHGKVYRAARTKISVVEVATEDRRRWTRDSSVNWGRCYADDAPEWLGGDLNSRREADGAFIWRKVHRPIQGVRKFLGQCAAPVESHSTQWQPNVNRQDTYLQHISRHGTAHGDWPVESVILSTLPSNTLIYFV